MTAKNKSQTLLGLVSLVSLLVGAPPDAVGAGAADKRFTFCTVQLNSSDETDQFKNRLDTTNPGQFVFKELTDMGPGESDWFQAACDSGIQCDVLLISGHFTGQFTGTRNGRFTKLTLEDIEKQQCKKKCQGVLKNPEETFLFGCNTLATKETDFRTKEVYHEVLRTHTNLHRITREKTVESRYGRYGDMFRNRTRFAFGGSQNIYGFWSVDPTGDEAKPFIENYLQDKPDYAKWLEELAVKRLQAGLSFVNNDDLGTAFSHLNFLQCGSMDPTSSEYEHESKVCTIWDDNVPRLDKLKLIDKMSSNSDFETFLPNIQDFFESNSAADYSPDEKKALKAIVSERAAKTTLVDIIHSTTDQEVLLPLELIDMGKQVGWISATTGAQLRYEMLKRAVALDFAEETLYPATMNKHEQVLCDASWQPEEAAMLTGEDLGQALHSAEVMQCLASSVHPTNPELLKAVSANLESDDATLKAATQALLDQAQNKQTSTTGAQ